MSEKQYYDQGSNSCSAPEGNSCGHYTQVVWRDSTTIGCDSGDGVFIICSYKNCSNNVSHEAARQDAIDAVKERNLVAFMPKTGNIPPHEPRGRAKCIFSKNHLCFPPVLQLLKGLAIYVILAVCKI